MNDTHPLLLASRRLDHGGYAVPLFDVEHLFLVETADSADAIARMLSPPLSCVVPRPAPLLSIVSYPRRRPPPATRSLARPAGRPWHRRKVGFFNMCLTAAVLSGLNPLVVVAVALAWRLWASSKFLPRGSRFNPEV